jgi:hypothetical protein
MKETQFEAPLCKSTLDHHYPINRTKMCPTSPLWVSLSLGGEKQGLGKWSEEG